MCVYMLINVISRECFLLSGYYLLIKKPVDDNYYVSLYFFFFFFFNFGDTFHWLDDNRAFTMQEARAFVSPTGANIDTHSQTNNAWFLALRFFFFFFFSITMLRSGKTHLLQPYRSISISIIPCPMDTFKYSN